MLSEKLIAESFVLCPLEVHALIEVGLLAEVAMWVWNCVISIFRHLVTPFPAWSLKKFSAVNQMNPSVCTSSILPRFSLLPIFFPLMYV